jgi:hypothetical protein
LGQVEADIFEAGVHEGHAKGYAAAFFAIQARVAPGDFIAQIDVAPGFN